MFLRLNIPRIPKELEKKFTLEYNKRTIPFARLVFIIVLLFLPFYYYLDFISSQESCKTLWLIRTLGLVLPSVLMIFISLWKKFYVYYQLIMSLYLFIMSASIIAMIYVCRSDESCYNFYFIGILTINALTLMSRLKYKNALSIYLLTAILYFSVAILKQHLSDTLLYNDFLFFVSVLTAYTLAHFFLESYMRNLFLNELKLKDANDELTYQNQKIFQQNEELQILNSRLHKQKEELEHYNKKINDSINYAQRIQKALLPQVDVLQSVVANYFIYFYPKDIVSGDFYWWTKKGDYFFFALADCTGHGVPGAFMSMLGISLLEKIVITQNINQTNEIIYHLTKSLKFLLKYNDKMNINDTMDIALLKLDKKNKFLQYSGIHINTLILTKNKHNIKSPKIQIIENDNNYLYQINADKFQAGYHNIDQFKFTSVIIPIDPSDSIFIFSDGLSDQMSPNMHKLTKARIRNLIIENSTFPLQTIGEKVMKSFHNWKQDKNQTDDVLFVGLEL